MRKAFTWSLLVLGLSCLSSGAFADEEKKPDADSSVLQGASKEGSPEGPAAKERERDSRPKPPRTPEPRHEREMPKGGDGAHQEHRQGPPAEHSAERVTQMFDHFDANHDGSISREEFEAAAAKIHEKMQDRMQAARQHQADHRGPHGGPGAVGGRGPGRGWAGRHAQRHPQASHGGWGRGGWGQVGWGRGPGLHPGHFRSFGHFHHRPSFAQGNFHRGGWEQGPGRWGRRHDHRGYEHHGYGHHGYGHLGRGYGHRGPAGWGHAEWERGPRGQGHFAWSHGGWDTRGAGRGPAMGHGRSIHAGPPHGLAHFSHRQDGHRPGMGGRGPEFPDHRGFGRHEEMKSMHADGPPPFHHEHEMRGSGEHRGPRPPMHARGGDEEFRQGPPHLRDDGHREAGRPGDHAEHRHPDQMRGDRPEHPQPGPREGGERRGPPPREQMRDGHPGGERGPGDGEPPRRGPGRGDENGPPRGPGRGAEGFRPERGPNPGGPDQNRSDRPEGDRPRSEKPDAEKPGEGRADQPSATDDAVTAVDAAVPPVVPMPEVLVSQVSFETESAD